MKYHELNDIQFVKCYDCNIQTKEKHDLDEQTDEGCLECMDLYIDLQNDLIQDFMDENPKREVITLREQSNYEKNGKLCFALWSMPN